VQELLAAEGVASLVFNYSGYGRSTGWIDADQLELDAICAFAYLRALRPQARISLLGFSLGSAIATAVVTKVAPHRLVLCSAFTSFRKAAASLGVPTWLARLLPDRWDVEQALRSAAAPPLLILHGGADRLFPVRSSCPPSSTTRRLMPPAASTGPGSRASSVHPERFANTRIVRSSPCSGEPWATFYSL
jgi:alpha-beta hydrolase superfamily lysophospholipase